MSRGNGRVYRRTYRYRGNLKESAVWWIEFSFRGHPIRESSKSTRHKDAVAYLRRRQDEVARVADASATSFTDMETLIVSDYRINGRVSAKRLEGALKHLRAFFGGQHALDITIEKINAYIERRHTGDGAKAATLNVELATLGRMFTLALHAGKILAKPHISKLQANNARQGFFERDQLEAVLSHLPDDLKAPIEVSFITGWRLRSEILTRRPEHIDLVNNWIRLNPNETKNKEGRNFPLSGRLHKVVAAQVARNEALQASTGSPVLWLFNREGEPIRDYRRAWAKACELAGVSGRQPHDLRRSAARNFEVSGVPRSAAMKLIGHRTESMYQRYAIADATMLKDAVEKLDRFYENQSHRNADKEHKQPSEDQPTR